MSIWTTSRNDEGQGTGVVERGTFGNVATSPASKTASGG